MIRYYIQMRKQFCFQRKIHLIFLYYNLIAVLLRPRNCVFYTSQPALACNLHINKIFISYIFQRSYIHELAHTTVIHSKDYYQQSCHAYRKDLGTFLILHGVTRGLRCVYVYRYFTFQHSTHIF